MFLLRSAFWLTVAFVVIRPDVEVDTGALSAQAMAAGQKFAVEQAFSSACARLSCVDGASLLTAVTSSSTPSLDATMQASSNSPVPFPRPRPDWMG